MDSFGYALSVHTTIYLSILYSSSAKKTFCVVGWGTNKQGWKVGRKISLSKRGVHRIFSIAFHLIDVTQKYTTYRTMNDKYDISLAHSESRIAYICNDHWKVV